MSRRCFQRLGLEKHAHLPILIVSASAFPGDLDAGRAAGADDYIAKPFANAELLARATTLLRRRQ